MKKNDNKKISSGLLEEKKERPQEGTGGKPSPLAGMEQGHGHAEPLERGRESMYGSSLDISDTEIP